MKPTHYFWLASAIFILSVAYLWIGKAKVLDSYAYRRGYQDGLSDCQDSTALKTASIRILAEDIRVGDIWSYTIDSPFNGRIIEHRYLVLNIKSGHIQYKDLLTNEITKSSIYYFMLGAKLESRE